MTDRRTPYSIRRLALVAIALLFTLSACEFHTGDNGPIDGFWHLESMENLQTGEVTHVGNQTLFWAYQADLMYLQGATTGDFFLRFRYADNTLTLYEPRAYAGHAEGGDPLVTDAQLLSPYGITALEETFHIERLGDGKMVLASASYRLSFTQF